jgi:AraC-like DNA-binding protein
MAVQLFLPDGTKVTLQGVIRKKYRGLLLPGSKVLQGNFDAGTITIQEFETPVFSISHRIFELFSKLRLTASEGSGLRLEALLTGEVTIWRNNEKIKLKAGQYHLTDIPLFNALFKKETSCSIFITHYSCELLDQLGITAHPSPPSKMSNEMATLIQEMLHNPYEEKLRNFYYENSVRELLFFHLAQGVLPIPGHLENKEISSIYKADAIISSHLNEHITIEKLSRMTGTNQFKLKKGFKQIFGMGVFQRLLHLRMEQAKMLLETTDKSIGEISELAGYDTAAGFIHAFRREFDMTPREWRLRAKSHDD